MSHSWVPPVTVTLVPSNDIYIVTTPAVQVQKAQPVGIAVAGADQTVTVAPSE